MNKRKSSKPIRLDGVKRQRLTWNAFEGVRCYNNSSENRSLNVFEEKEILEAEDLLQTNVNKPEKPRSLKLSRKKSLVDESLQMMIDKFDFYLTIFKDLPKQDSLAGILGRFYIWSSEQSATFNVLFDHVINSAQKFYLYIDKTSRDHLVLVEMDDFVDDPEGSERSTSNKNIYFSVGSDLPSEIFSAFQPKDLILRRSDSVSDKSNERRFAVDICLADGAMFGHGRAITLRRINSDLRVLMAHFYGIKIPEVFNKKQITAKSNNDLDILFSEVKKRKCINMPTANGKSQLNVQPANLRPQLRKYQKEAVHWMLEKELWKSRDNDKYSNFELEKYFEEVSLVDGTSVFFNPRMGIISKHRPEINVPSLGGILADEMGLGKTVEVLACILLNPRDNLPFPSQLPTLKPKDRSFSRLSKIKKSVKKNQYTLAHGVVSRCGQNESGDGLDVQPGSSSTSSSTGSSLLTPTDSPSSLPTAMTDCHEHDRSLLDRKEKITQSGKGLDVETPSSASSPGTVSTSSSLSGFPTLTDSPEHGYAKSPKKSMKREKTKSGMEKKGKSENFLEATKVLAKHLSSDDFSLADLQISGAVTIDDNDDNNASSTECICGGEIWGQRKKDDLDKMIVICQKCGSGQHAGCVNYDLTDPFRGRYLCPHCHVAEIPIPSGATLIVTPSSILHQWIDEILKHVSNDALKIFVYSGVHKQGFVQPMTLARQDIVMTTYETLRKEIDYVDLPHTNSEGLKKFRHPKRFMAIPSPIVAVEWWRICLDEAQMVECTTAKTAEMALRLTCINRWCVTGTPIQRGIDDLYGLFAFLRVAPYLQKIFWTKLLYEPYCSGEREPLYEAVSQVLWRTSKKDVIDQIMLPAQSNDMHLLTFTPVEEHFYRRLYQDCLSEASQKLSKLTDMNLKMNNLDKATVHQLLYPLLKLRQACCHPQAVRGEFFSINKSTMTMTDLLDQLIKKVRYECEEAQRQIVLATNGLAGWYILKEDYANAISEYRSVLSMAEEREGSVRVDPLQTIHAVHNLQEIMELCPAHIRGHTLRDSELSKLERDAEQKYMTKRTEFIARTREGWLEQRNAVIDSEKQMNKAYDWWVKLLEWIDECGLEDSLVERIQVDLLENNQDKLKIKEFRFRTIKGFQYILTSNLDKLNEMRPALTDLLQVIDHISSSTLQALTSTSPPSSATSPFLSSQALQDLVSQTRQCCVRPDAYTEDICPFCKLNEMINKYESYLFSFNDKEKTEQFLTNFGEEVGKTDKQRYGNHHDSETEKALKCLLSFAQKYSGDKELIDLGMKHFKLFEAMKKEFKTLRPLWQALREMVTSVDEISMGITRLRFRKEYEEITDPPQPHIIERGMMEEQKLKLVSDRVVGEHLLKKKKSQLQYLKGLLETHGSMEKGMNPEPCPICQNRLGSKWSVLQCGHCFCLSCTRILVSERRHHNHNQPRNHLNHKNVSNSIHSFKCPVCRQRTSASDIAYVSTKSSVLSTSGGNEKYNDENIKVKGDWSTKIEGVLRVLLHIVKDDPQVKILIFSTWQDVLELLAKALLENNITFCSLINHYKFEENLHRFKEDLSINCLLLPIHSGSNGLNLTEATHVILVEPILNPAQELQAIGRVHRIGQTKPTFVHRFLVKGTIEEKLHHLLTSVEVPTEWRNSDETTLTLNDFGGLFSALPTDSLGEDDEDEGTLNDPCLNNGSTLKEATSRDGTACYLHN